MNVRKLLCFMAMACHTLLFCLQLTAQGPMGGFEEDFMNNLMGFLDQMKPEEQEEFWKQVEAETLRIEEETAGMSEDEKMAYLDRRMSEELQKVEPTSAAPAVTFEPKPADVSPAPVKKPTAPTEVFESSEIIQSIIKSIQSFLTKAKAFPDFERKVDNWAKQHLLSSWSYDQTWDLFKKDLDKFTVLLQRFQEKDPKIGMKHIDTLSANESVVQMLKLLENKLSQEVPSIDVSVFSIADMSKQTKNAIAHTINALSESMIQQNLFDHLQRIIEEFDPIAKKLREEEEKATKKALSQAPKSASQIPVRTAGKAENNNDFFLPSFDDYGYGNYGGYGDYNGGYGGGYGNYGDYGSGSAGKSGSSNQSGRASRGGAGVGKTAETIDAEKKKQKEEEDKKKEEGKNIKDQDVKEQVDNFKKSISAAHEFALNVKDSI